MRILELFSGIGAVSEAAGAQREVACAIDISQPAMQVYRANFGSPTLTQEITSLTDRQLADFGADLWWMSPPCQPFTRRGLQKDLDDPRTQPLLRLIGAIERVTPDHIALENVVGFEKSRTFDLLVETLDRIGYHIASSQLCSTDFGLPNIRPRFFVAASRISKPNLAPSASPAESNRAEPGHAEGRSVAGFLDNAHQLKRWQSSLAVDRQQLGAYAEAINIVTDDSRQTRCFTSAYGRSIVRSGSYLKTQNGFRRFSPGEQARLLGFSARYKLPQTLNVRQLWKLLGNTVSVPCAKHVLDTFL